MAATAEIGIGAILKEQDGAPGHGRSTKEIFLSHPCTMCNVCKDGRIGTESPVQRVAPLLLGFRYPRKSGCS